MQWPRAGEARWETVCEAEMGEGGSGQGMGGACGRQRGKKGRRERRRARETVSERERAREREGTREVRAGVTIHSVHSQAALPAAPP